MTLKGFLKKISSNFNNIVLIFSILVFIFCVYKLGLYFIDHINARTANTLASTIFYEINKADSVSGKAVSASSDPDGLPSDLNNTQKEYTACPNSSYDVYEDSVAGQQGKIVILVDDIGNKVNVNKTNGKNNSESDNSNTDMVGAVGATVGIDETGGSLNNESKPGEISQRFVELIKINEDIIGWIRIPDSNVDYPVVQGKDNDFYLKRNHEKKESRYGSIFMDSRNNYEALDKNTILYGHHMTDGMMFNNVVKYKQNKFFESHPFVFFNTLYNELKWEVFSIYVTDVNFNYLRVSFETDNDFLEFVDLIKGKSIYKKDINFDNDDIILTLSTCSYEFDNARTVVHAKLIN